MVNALLTSISIKPVDVAFTSPLLAWNACLEPQTAKALDVLKHFVSQYVIQVPQVQIVEYKGQQIIMDIFEALTLPRLNVYFRYTPKSFGVRLALKATK